MRTDSDGTSGDTLDMRAGCHRRPSLYMDVRSLDPNSGREDEQ